ncbi:hypothetical protein BAUCODRAFT_219396 [Baudoinia panamericana UAMH 10762]|uniref:Uncharacterized protein n=1 Tax=Baudoinia panamericana (strain UAMH 10762) TaxID=717646 RepID=M2MRG1_BAUPA|nr:uncharacterized protein BAUCODRAFT_219396 [Baudoinia panamericana UAMH 10762]EMC94043.1 hypothetical protein BAUCODRAFT_219396 [Baudoinia panamericana UAMH 10762]
MRFHHVNSTALQYCHHNAKATRRRHHGSTTKCKTAASRAVTLKTLALCRIIVGSGSQKPLWPMDKIWTHLPCFAPRGIMDTAPPRIYHAETWSVHDRLTFLRMSFSVHACDCATPDASAARIASNEIHDSGLLLSIGPTQTVLRRVTSKLAVSIPCDNGAVWRL